MMRLPVTILASLFALGHLMVSTPSQAQNPASVPGADDPWLWLEEVDSERSLDWVRARNAVSQAELEADPRFADIRQRLLGILDSDARIPYVSRQGEWFYNFWRDERHPRGLWRRTSLAEYRQAEPQWETVLDLDALAAREHENWVWSGAIFLKPDYDRALLQLSRGGADATVVREFDLNTGNFVEGGFALPEAKSDLSWIDKDTLYVGTDFGPGSQTDSGYSRIAKRWRRGTALNAAETVFEGLDSDVWAGAYLEHDHGLIYEFAATAPTFFTSRLFLRQDNDWVALAKPDDAEAATLGEQLLIRLKSEWSVGEHSYPAGALLAIDFKAFMAGRRDFAVLFTPSPRTALDSFVTTRNYLITNVLDNVRNRLYAHRLDAGGWTRTELPTPGVGTASVSALDADHSDDYFLTFSGFLRPTSLFLASVANPEPVLLKSLPAFFSTQGMQVEQHEAVSKDGTQVPYFVVSREDLRADGSNPTLLYGYGGFEVSMTPSYSATVGAAWLERGGVYVLANIRGGGEFGPAWHNAARREHRQRAYDDFIAIAEDLMARGITSPAHLGIQGGSNGGLLMGVMLTQRPELFGAVVSQVPLLDMRRYNRLLAGASWMDEYGNPDIPEDWAFIRTYSPYQNVGADIHYPRVLFTTSTRDDRVHPAHARKMVARMLEQGHDVLYYENIEGGHGGAANNQQAAYMSALAYTFLWRQLRESPE
ncbi:MAG: prolyl oligopeptidase family serine peptidase [Pseudomonadales bacterium]|nr:prolyl oligopeptidase family serine peptidase [Pseudomonadales bacterium]